MRWHYPSSGIGLFFLFKFTLNESRSIPGCGGFAIFCAGVFIGLAVNWDNLRDHSLTCFAMLLLQSMAIFFHGLYDTDLKIHVNQSTHPYSAGSPTFLARLYLPCVIVLSCLAFSLLLSQRLVARLG